MTWDVIGTEKQQASDAIQLSLLMCVYCAPFADLNDAVSIRKRTRASKNL